MIFFWGGGGCGDSSASHSVQLNEPLIVLIEQHIITTHTNNTLNTFFHNYEPVNYFTNSINTLQY